jgi:uncharacterized RDD family membrane protein YckC
VADSVVYGVSLLALLLFIEGADVPSGVGVPLFWAWVAAAVAYEPMLVWWRGATLGHSLYNLYVADAKTGRPPSLPRAVARTWLKALLGLLSFGWMALTRRHQALHDLATGTLVEVSDLARARPDDLLVERPPDALVVGVPIWRRVLVIVLAVALATTLQVAALATLMVMACPEERCPPGLAVLDPIIGLIWLAAVVAVIVLGWRGQLPGARA